MYLPYTICFCLCQDNVLMLYRNKHPNQYRWNGVGGKLQEGETPLTCIQREVMEEAELDLANALSLRFSGIVTWNFGADITRPSTGMYTYIAELSAAFPLWSGERVISEGRLCWHPLQWVCDPHNTEVVSNIPRFLPHMLHRNESLEYHCEYDEQGQLIDFTINPISGLANIIV